jgi:predicted dehydrogenase
MTRLIEEERMTQLPVGVGIVGANPERGWAARAHVPAIHASGEFRLVAVATTRAESAALARERFAVCRNASVRYFAPEAFAVAARVSVVLK